MAALKFLRSSSLVLSIALVGITSLSPLKTQAQTVGAEPVSNSDCPTDAQKRTPADDQPVVRGEFATGVNNCINRVDDLSRRSRTGAAAKTDLEALIQRQREINLELRSINDRLGNLTNP